MASMKWRWAMAIVAVGWTMRAAGGPPAPPPQTMPGRVLGHLESRWLGPGVSVTRYVGTKGEYLVTWRSADGPIRREVRMRFEPHAGYLIEDDGTINGVNEDWKFKVEDRPDGSIQGSADSRVFIHQYAPKPGEAAADVYVSGVRASTLGPYPRNRLDSLTIGQDGSVAMLVRKDAKAELPSVVLAGVDGKQRLIVDCAEDVCYPQPSPGGNAALVMVTGTPKREPYVLYDKTGKVSTVDLGPNGWFVTWVHDTETAVMEVAIGDKEAWEVVDFRAGKRLLAIKDPCPVRAVSGSSCGVAIVNDLMLISGLEYQAWEDQKMPRKSIYALSLKDGHVVAHWSGPRATLDHGRFLELHGRLYYVTDQEVCEIKAEEIEGKEHGWK
jgi:hypothetical protein